MTASPSPFVLIGFADFVTTIDLTLLLDCSCFGAIQLAVSVSGAESLGTYVKTWALPPGIFIDSCDCPGRFHG
jgi:hypothetical protein